MLKLVSAYATSDVQRQPAKRRLNRSTRLLYRGRWVSRFLNSKVNPRF